MSGVEVPIKVNYVLFVKVIYTKDGYVHFEGSHERIFLGLENPFQVGDDAKITFERITSNAKP